VPYINRLQQAVHVGPASPSRCVATSTWMSEAVPWDACSKATDAQDISSNREQWWAVCSMRPERYKQQPTAVPHRQGQGAPQPPPSRPSGRPQAQKLQGEGQGRDKPVDRGRSSAQQPPCRIETPLLHPPPARAEPPAAADQTGHQAGCCEERPQPLHAASTPRTTYQYRGRGALHASRQPTWVMCFLCALSCPRTK
jgi:hypothetical protein